MTGAGREGVDRSVVQQRDPGLGRSGSGCSDRASQGGRQVATRRGRGARATIGAIVRRRVPPAPPAGLPPRGRTRRTGGRQRGRDRRRRRIGTGGWPGTSAGDRRTSADLPPAPEGNRRPQVPDPERERMNAQRPDPAGGRPRRRPARAGQPRTRCTLRHPGRLGRPALRAARRHPAGPRARSGVRGRGRQVTCCGWNTGLHGRTAVQLAGVGKCYGPVRAVGGLRPGTARRRGSRPHS